MGRTASGLVPNFIETLLQQVLRIQSWCNFSLDEQEDTDVKPAQNTNIFKSKLKTFLVSLLTTTNFFKVILKMLSLFM